MILDAAHQVIAAEGIGGVRLRGVAAVAGLSLGSTTYHFPDRTELIDEALSEHTAVIEVIVASAITGLAASDAPDATCAAALSEVYAQRDRAVITSELWAHSVRSVRARGLAQRIHTAVHTLVTRGWGVDDRRAWLSIAALDAAVVTSPGRTTTHQGSITRCSSGSPTRPAPRADRLRMIGLGAVPQVRITAVPQSVGRQITG